MPRFDPVWSNTEADAFAEGVAWDADDFRRYTGQNIEYLKAKNDETAQVSSFLGHEFIKSRGAPLP